MTRDQVKRTLEAARDIVQHADNPITTMCLDPLTVQWARELLTVNKPKPRIAPAREKLMALYDADLLASWTTKAIAEATSRDVKKVREMCNTLAHEGILFQLGGGQRNTRTAGIARFFCSAMARELARPAYEAALAAAKKPPRVPRPPRAERPLKIPRLAKERKPRINLARRETTSFNPTDELKVKPRAPVRSVFHSGEAFIPDHVKVQVIETKPSRYAVTAPADGFLAEFKRLRGEAS